MSTKQNKTKQENIFFSLKAEEREIVSEDDDEMFKKHFPVNLSD